MYLCLICFIPKLLYAINTNIGSDLANMFFFFTMKIEDYFKGSTSLDRQNLWNSLKPAADRQ